MGNKDKSLKHSYERKNTFYISRYTKIFKLGSLLRQPIDKAGWTSSYSSEDPFPGVSLSAKKLNFLLMIVIWKRMEIILMSQDECY